MPLAGLRRKIATIARAAGVSGAEHRAFEFEILPPSQWAGPRLCAVIGRRAVIAMLRAVSVATNVGIDVGQRNACGHSMPVAPSGGPDLLHGVTTTIVSIVISKQMWQLVRMPFNPRHPYRAYSALPSSHLLDPLVPSLEKQQQEHESRRSYHRTSQRIRRAMTCCRKSRMGCKMTARLETEDPAVTLQVQQHLKESSESPMSTLQRNSLKSKAEDIQREKKPIQKTSALKMKQQVNKTTEKGCQVGVRTAELVTTFLRCKKVDVLGEDYIKLKHVFEIRWLRREAIQSVLRNYRALAVYTEEQAAAGDPTAIGLHQQLTRYLPVALLHLLADVLDATNHLSRLFHSLSAWTALRQVDGPKLERFRANVRQSGQFRETPIQMRVGRGRRDPLVELDNIKAVFLERILENLRARVYFLQVFEPAAYPVDDNKVALTYWGRHELNTLLDHYEEQKQATAARFKGEERVNEDGEATFHFYRPTELLQKMFGGVNTDNQRISGEVLKLMCC
ncbi:hypothetical protein Bbelb_381630 [Branchiostoma belcheri]|nr:hypothetical protein Bbelb_381630 [Branchiostoma belcheri]